MSGENKDEKKEDGAKRAYDEFVKLKEAYDSIRGVGNSFAAPKSLEEKVGARRNAEERYKKAFNVSAKTQVSDSMLEEYVVFETAKNKEDTVNYFNVNKDAIMNVCIGNLEKNILDMPIISTKSEKHDEQAKKHLEYATFREIAGKYMHGEDLKRDELGFIIQNSALAFAKETAEDLKKKGYSEELQSLGADIAYRIIQTHKPEELVLKYADNHLKHLKEDFEKGFNDKYTKADYARESIDAIAKQNPESAMEILQKLGQSKSEKK
jgi:hypothetical protein